MKDAVKSNLYSDNDRIHFSWGSNQNFWKYCAHLCSNVTSDESNCNVTVLSNRVYFMKSMAWFCYILT